MQWNKSDREPAVGYQGQGRATARAQPPKRLRSRRLAFGRSRFSVARQKVVQATFMQVLEFCPTRRVCAPRYHDEPNSNRKERVIPLICPPQHWVNTDNTVQSGRKLFASFNSSLHSIVPGGSKRRLPTAEGLSPKTSGTKRCVKTCAGLSIQQPRRGEVRTVSVVVAAGRHAFGRKSRRLLTTAGSECHRLADAKPLYR